MTKESSILVAGAGTFDDFSPEIWGTGAPRREFVFVDDVADACGFLMQNYDEPMPINSALRGIPGVPFRTALEATYKSFVATGSS